MPSTENQAESTVTESDEVAVQMPKAKRLAYVIAVFCSILSHMFLYYAVNTISTNIASDIGGTALFALMFTLGILTQTVLQPMTPRLSDYFSKGRLVILGSILLLLQTVVCLVAPNLPIFLIGRGIGGLGAALLFTLGIASFSDILPIQERAKYLGIYGTIMAIAGAAGPVLAGAIVDLTGTWRIVFIIPLLLSIASVILAFICAPRTKLISQGEQDSFDGFGALWLGLSLISIVSLLSFVDVYFYWGDLISMVLIVIFVICMVLFILTERKKGLAAIVPLSLFGIRTFTIVFVVSLLLTCVACYAYFGPAFVQTIMGLNATSAGLLVTIPSLISIFLATMLGVWLSRTGRYKGLLLAAALTLALVFFFLSLMGPETSVFLLLANGAVFFGIGNTIMSFAPIATVQAKIEPSLVGVATALVMFSQTLGSMLIIAIGGAVFNAFADAAAGYIWIFRGCTAIGIFCFILLLFLPGDKKKLETVTQNTLEN